MRDESFAATTRYVTHAREAELRRLVPGRGRAVLRHLGALCSAAWLPHPLRLATSSRISETMGDGLLRDLCFLKPWMCARCWACRAGTRPAPEPGVRAGDRTLSALPVPSALQRAQYRI